MSLYEYFMWHWIRDYRRKKILKSPFPIQWENILQKNVNHYKRLDNNERNQLHDLIQVFIAEKTWEGCGGLMLTDEIRVTIAAEACIIILGLPHDIYRNVDSILIHPTTVISPQRKIGFSEIVNAPLAPLLPILGEAHMLGPVILVGTVLKMRLDIQKQDTMLYIVIC